MQVCPKCARSNVEHARFCSSCGTALDRPPSATDDPLLGFVVAGRYRIVRPIGEGGMGRVYLAEQPMGNTLRAVAIKVLTTSLSDTQGVARFYRECETVVQLSHPNTIRFYDFGRVDVPHPGGLLDARLFIAMEYIDGRSLAKALEDGPMPLETVLRLVRQIGGALTEAHRRGIVHRDLKPDNVLLGRTDADGLEFPKVCDFGIAKRDDSGAEITAQGTVVGTPAYMSPEQISGNPVDARSDVYALALMTYEMLTGSRPFVAKTPLEWATAHMTAEPRSFDIFPSTRGLAPERRAAILRALTKDVARRTPSVREFVEELCGAPLRSEESWAPGAGPRDSRSELGAAATLAATPQAISNTEPPLRVPERSLWPVVLGVTALLGAGAGGFGMLALAPDDDPLPVTDELGDAGAPEDAEPPDAGDPTMPSEWSQILQFEDKVTDATASLGPPDGRCARIRPGGTIHVELTPGVRMETDGDAGADVRVIVLDDSVPYRLDVGVERGQFTTIAQGLITSTPLDVDQYGIRRFRYIRVKNRESRGEVCVDAIGTFAHPTD